MQHIQDDPVRRIADTLASRGWDIAPDRWGPHRAYIAQRDGWRVHIRPVSLGARARLSIERPGVMLVDGLCGREEYRRALRELGLAAWELWSHDVIRGLEAAA